MIHGMINVYKERGFTSHDVVAKLRKMTGQKKIGHTGTLDPDAEGVLPVCLGKGTKLCELLSGGDKTYEAVLLLGKETDTQDISGKVLSEKSTSSLTEDEVREAVLSFQGEYAQIPPMYSAVKVGGKKLYELARSGRTVERKARQVKIRDIRVREISLPRVSLSVTCSKGTYIRTLCHDIGKKLGTGGCMEKLTRTRVGRFTLEEAKTLEELTRIFAEGREREVVIPVDELFPDLRKVQVKEEYETAARNGNALPETAVEAFGTLGAVKSFMAGTDGGESVRLYDRAGRFIALYRRREEAGEYRLEKMFFPER